MSEITANPKEKGAKQVTAKATFFKPGWYDISSLELHKKDLDIKYIYYPGNQAYKNAVYYQQKREEEIKQQKEQGVEVTKAKFEIDKDQYNKNVWLITSQIRKAVMAVNKENKSDKISQLLTNLSKFDPDPIYKGISFKEGKTDYRADGSIVFGEEHKAYKFIWDMTLLLKVEHSCVIGTSTVLVEPSYFNIPSSALFREYGYEYKNAEFYDVLTSSIFKTLGTVHTHPGGTEEPSTWTYDSYGDLGFATFSTPLKPAYVFALNEQLSISFIISDKDPEWAKNGYNFKYKTEYLTRNYSYFNILTVSKGKISLRDWTKQNLNNLLKILK